MHMFGPDDDPPLEAYSRVSDPERFRPLHARVLDRLAALFAEYDVIRTASFEPPPGALLRAALPFEHALPPVTLTPRDPAAAPVAVAFTPFPGLIVRYGRWQHDRFPACGCDACRETADGEHDRFTQLLGDVVAGRLREELRIPWIRQPRLRWWLGESGAAARPRDGGFRVLSRHEATAFRAAGTGVVAWQPWPQRRGGRGGG